MEQWVKKSKTVKAGIVTELMGLFMIIFGAQSTPPKTIDEIGKEQKDTTSKVVGLGLLGAGGLTLKGRADAQKKIKGDKK